jgi:signal transduction histidine kinase
MVRPSSEHPSDVPNVAWSDVVRFIRQLSHDLRNHLNAIELQSGYISELERDDELKSEIKRLREMIAGMTSTLQSLSKAVSAIKPNLIPYPAADFMEDLRKNIDHDFSGQNAEIIWNVQLGGAILNVDPQLLQETFTEIFGNALRHDRGEGPLVATATIDKNQFVFRLKEPKAQFELPTDNWGREPLGKIGQGHYGLGLNRVRAIVQAHGGKLYAQHDPKTRSLVTTLALPL